MSYRFTSADGLCRSNDAGHVATWDRIGATLAAEQREWNARLRAQGVKAAHPDDGWVDRANSTVQFSYPAFDDRVQVGDLIALGWPWRGYRIVRCTDVETRRGPLLTRMLYHFEAVGEGEDNPK